jgi:hypothetical protein
VVVVRSLIADPHKPIVVCVVLRHVGPTLLEFLGPYAGRFDPRTFTPGAWHCHNGTERIAERSMRYDES